jgi:hypothetical protein
VSPLSGSFARSLSRSLRPQHSRTRTRRLISASDDSILCAKPRIGMAECFLSWVPLPVQADSIPNLLASATITASSYTIRLTDLAHVWTETLDRRGICKRGFEEDTSIDPSEGPDQMEEFLKRVRASLDASLPGHDDTSLSLSRDAKSSQEAGSGLVLHLTCILPRPLRPLKWPIRLSMRASSGLALELVLPLIRAQAASSKQAESLLALLRQKDAVITRLIDKLEATGTGLEQVFNPLTGRRKITRAAAEERVRGLAPFQDDKFRKESAFAQESIATLSVKDLLGAVFASSAEALNPIGANLIAADGLDDWWSKLRTGDDVVLVERRKASSGNEHKHMSDAEREYGRRPGEAEGLPAGVDEDETEGEEDDFQVQATPPHLAGRLGSSQQRPSQEGYAGDGGGDVDDETIPETAPNGPSQSRATEHPADLPSGQNLRATAKTSSTPSAESDTASDEDEVEGEPPRAKLTTPSKKPHRVGGIGRIGGKAKTPDQAKAETPAAASNNQPDESPQKTRRIGIIGNRASPSPAKRRRASVGADEGPDGHQKVDSSARGNIEEKSSQPGLDEIEEERADRKRQELKRALQGRAGTTTKKKRKF